MEKVKIKDIKTGAIKEVNATLAGDYVGTGKFVVVEDKKKLEFEKPTFSKNSREK